MGIQIFVALLAAALSVGILRMVGYTIRVLSGPGRVGVGELIGTAVAYGIVGAPLFVCVRYLIGHQ